MRVRLLFWLLLAGAVVSAAAALTVPALAAASRRQGSVTLHRCSGGRPGWCGSILRALDPTLSGSPSIPIGFEWLPARHPAGATTIVAVEGGPGFPTTGSVSEYEAIFGPLLQSHNLLLVDNRGTGSSALIRCPSLDDYPADAPAIGARFDARVAACAARLDDRWHAASGAPIHAADLFGSADAADDLAGVISALGTGPVELYGDSYGSWFAQVFAARHPALLRSLVLDSTYAVRGLDPYYASSGLVAREALTRVCARDPGCATDAPGSPVARLARLLARLRRRPLGGTALTRHGSPRVAVGPSAMVNLVQNAGFDPLIWRELDASVRAALAGDDVPLLRMAADNASDQGDSDPAQFSDGDYFAVSCTDYPQLFSLSATPAQRRAQYAAAIRAAPPGAFAPFTAAEWVTMSGYSETYDSCLDWPAPTHDLALEPPDLVPLPASVPVLVLGGDLDDLTPLSDAERFGPTLGATVRVIDLRNTTHVTSEGDNFLADGAACAQSIIQRFERAPADVETLDARCAARIPHLHTPGAYPRLLAGVRPARRIGGRAASALTRRAAVVAAEAFADAVVHGGAAGVTHGAGLRGGTFAAHVLHGGAVAITLSGARFVADAAVSGTGTYAPADGGVTARLRVLTAGGGDTVVSLQWDQRSLDARAIAGGAVLSLPAP